MKLTVNLDLTSCGLEEISDIFTPLSSGYQPDTSANFYYTARRNISEDNYLKVCKINRSYAVNCGEMGRIIKFDGS
jgi:hypothetical protein